MPIVFCHWQRGNTVNWHEWSSEDIFAGCSTISASFLDAELDQHIWYTPSTSPASLSLQHLPTSIFASPDGACLILSFLDELRSCHIFRAYHWSTFGSTEGIALDVSPLKGEDIVLTSMVNRGCIHLMELDFDAHCCRSVALDITKKVTEFMFKEKGARSTSTNDAYSRTLNNSLIDCHAEVWTRFPVVPAVQRQTIVSAADRSQRKIIFVTEEGHGNFTPYFADLIRTFEQRTRKPTGDQLKGTAIEALKFDDFFTLLTTGSWSSSQFHAGEWLVNLLCLIPIHIAITRENRFIPLKDGVTSAELERLLLGAEVGRIVDSLSVGWYESIFQSYMADKVGPLSISFISISLMINLTSFLASKSCVFHGFVACGCPSRWNLKCLVQFRRTISWKKFCSQSPCWHLLRRECHEDDW